MLYPPTLQHAVYCSCLEANRATLYTVYHLPHQLPPPPAPATRDPMAKARACSSVVWQRPTRAPSKRWGGTAVVTSLFHQEEVGMAEAAGTTAGAAADFDRAVYCSFQKQTSYTFGEGTYSNKKLHLPLSPGVEGCRSLEGSMWVAYTGAVSEASNCCRKCCSHEEGDRRLQVSSATGRDDGGRCCGTGRGGRCCCGGTPLRPRTRKFPIPVNAPVIVPIIHQKRVCLSRGPRPWHILTRSVSLTRALVAVA
jgi:hypothetical protein